MFRRSSRRGFTLVEMLIAFAVMVVLTYGLYKMLVSGAKTATAGIWRSTTNRRLEAGAQRIRQSLESASFPAMVSPEFNRVDETADHFIVLGAGKDGVSRDVEILAGQDEADQDSTSSATYRAIGGGRTDDSDSTGDGDQLVLAASSCSPAQKRIPGLPEKDGVAKNVTFWLANYREVLRGGRFQGTHDLMYAVEEQTYGSGDVLTSGPTISVPGHPLGTIPSGGKVLIPDVNSVRLRVSYFDESSGAFAEGSGSVAPDLKPTLEVVIRCVDRDGGKAVIGKIIKVQTNTGVTFQ